MWLNMLLKLKGKFFVEIGSPFGASWADKGPFDFRLLFFATGLEMLPVIPKNPTRHRPQHKKIIELERKRIEEQKALEAQQEKHITDDESNIHDDAGAHSC